ncbi:MAG: 3-deoxy-7-phosphoheptulonate synthase [Spirochaetaceae bacterium]|nr:MAG: 3-deoxy-7-phosphoheptulonate synthase [Spirochaetaceae bacterium]
MTRNSDLRIVSATPLVPPEVLKQEYPQPDASARTVTESRNVIERILRGEDSRMLALVGPCSIYDPEAAFDYARRLKALSEKLQDQLYIVMRVYFEKPRTRLGWRGLVIDPTLDGRKDIQAGLRLARSILIEITSMGLPAGSEMLDPIVPQFLDDLVSWASIGARTTESQTHRDMASGLSMPVGFKNGTDGSVENAINAFSAAMHPQSFIGIDQKGLTSILSTRGNPAGHVILRGGRKGPNYGAAEIAAAGEELRAAKLPPVVMVDCSHANSGKDYRRQSEVLQDVVEQRAGGSSGIIGFMLESNINPGSQKLEDPETLEYGVSITDGCIGWEETEALLHAVHSVLAKGEGGQHE